MKNCIDGFNVKNYLEARAKASINQPAKKSSLKTKEKEVLNIPHPELYEELRLWRNIRAQELDEPAYLIFSQKTLLELVQKLPSTTDALKNIKGIGSKKIKQFGIEILDIIKEYCTEKNIEPTAYSDVDENLTLKPKTIDTKLTSLNLFKEGKSVAEIAAERGFVVSTIEGHLAHFVGTGEISIEQLLPSEKASIISAFFDDNPDSGLTPAKEALGDEFSYTELRFVLKHREWMENTSSK